MLIENTDGSCILTQHVYGLALIKKFDSRHKAREVHNRIIRKHQELKDQHANETINLFKNFTSWDQIEEDV